MSVALGDLTTYIESDVVITSNWIASTFEVGIQEAAALLQQYHSNNKGSTTAHYCVSGRNKGSALPFQVRIVHESALEAVKQELLAEGGSGPTSSRGSCSLYSLQRRRESSPDAGENLMQKTDEAIRDRIVEDPQKLVNSKFHVIQLPTLLIYDATTQPAATSKSSSGISVSKDVSKPAVSGGFFAKKSEPISGSSNINSSASIKGAPVPSVVDSTSSNKTVSSFFGKPTDKPPAVSSGSSTKIATASSKIEVDGSKPSPASMEEDDGDEFEFGGKSAPSVPVVKQLGDRRVIPGMKEQEEADTEKEKEKEKEKEEREKDDNDSLPSSPAKRKTREKDVVLYGALDDYTIDTSVSTGVKKKKKVLVEKFFTDEKGYLVTEKVYEEVTDDEADKKPINSSSSSSSSISAKPKPAPAPAPAKKTAPAPAGQKSMMSFFGKK